MADMLSASPEGTTNKDLHPSEVHKSESFVAAACDDITSFVNPFVVKTRIDSTAFLLML